MTLQGGYLGVYRLALLANFTHNVAQHLRVIQAVIVALVAPRFSWALALPFP
jgi:hypothetical protein